MNKRHKIMVVHLNPNSSITTLSVYAIDAPVKRNVTLFLFLIFYCWLVGCQLPIEGLNLGHGSESWEEC